MATLSDPNSSTSNQTSTPTDTSDQAPASTNNNDSDSHSSSNPDSNGEEQVPRIQFDSDLSTSLFPAPFSGVSDAESAFGRNNLSSDIWSITGPSLLLNHTFIPTLQESFASTSATAHTIMPVPVVTPTASSTSSSPPRNHGPVPTIPSNTLYTIPLQGSTSTLTSVGTASTPSTLGFADLASMQHIYDLYKPFYSVTNLDDVPSSPITLLIAHLLHMRITTDFSFQYAPLSDPVKTAIAPFLIYFEKPINSFTVEDPELLSVCSNILILHSETVTLAELVTKMIDLKLPYFPLTHLSQLSTRRSQLYTYAYYFPLLCIAYLVNSLALHYTHFPFASSMINHLTRHRSLYSFSYAFNEGVFDADEALSSFSFTMPAVRPHHGPVFFPLVSLLTSSKLQISHYFHAATHRYRATARFYLVIIFMLVVLSLFSFAFTATTIMHARSTVEVSVPANFTTVTQVVSTTQLSWSTTTSTVTVSPTVTVTPLVPTPNPALIAPPPITVSVPYPTPSLSIHVVTLTLTTSLLCVGSSATVSAIQPPLSTLVSQALTPLTHDWPSLLLDPSQYTPTGALIIVLALALLLTFCLLCCRRKPSTHVIS